MAPDIENLPDKILLEETLQETEKATIMVDNVGSSAKGNHKKGIQLFEFLTEDFWQMSGLRSKGNQKLKIVDQTTNYLDS